MRPCCHLRSYVFLQNEQEVAFILDKKHRVPESVTDFHMPPDARRRTTRPTS